MAKRLLRCYIATKDYSTKSIELLLVRSNCFNSTSYITYMIMLSL